MRYLPSPIFSIDFTLNDATAAASIASFKAGCSVKFNGRRLFISDIFKDKCQGEHRFLTNFLFDKMM